MLGCLVEPIFGATVPEIASFEIMLIGFLVNRDCVRQPLLLFRRQIQTDLTSYQRRQLALHAENIAEVPVIRFSPEMSLISYLDQLSCDVNALASSLHAAFQ